MAAMTARYYYLLRSSWLRLAELIFWPAMQMLVWGFLYTYLYDSKSSMASTGGILLGDKVTIIRDVQFVKTCEIHRVARNATGAQK